MDAHSPPGCGTTLPAVVSLEIPSPVKSWEGSQLVTGTRAGRSLTGKGYVELTGYAEGVPAAP